MTEILLPALFGLLGGLIRAIVGIFKHYKINKKTKFNLTYLLITIIISGIIGALASAAFSTDYIINLAIGYAGIDFLEGLLKIIKK